MIRNTDITVDGLVTTNGDATHITACVIPRITMLPLLIRAHMWITTQSQPNRVITDLWTETISLNIRSVCCVHVQYVASTCSMLRTHAVCCVHVQYVAYTCSMKCEECYDCVRVC